MFMFAIIFGQLIIFVFSDALNQYRDFSKIIDVGFAGQCFLLHNHLKGQMKCPKLRDIICG